MSAVTWDDRLAAAHAAYPASHQALLRGVDTARVVNGEELLIRLMRDVIATDNVEVRRGQRAEPDAEDGRRLLEDLRGLSYTTEAFHTAFRTLAGTRSLSQLVHRTGLSRTTIHRLLAGPDAGGKAPTPSEMEAVAEGFGHKPVYFAEYRVAMFVALVAEKLAENPDQSYALVRRLGLAR